MKKKILVNYALPQEGLTELYKHFEVIYPQDGAFTRSEVLSLITDCAGIFSAQIKVDQELMDQAPQLKIVSNYGAGYDNVDIPYATKQGIMVTNIPDTVTKPTAELTLALILSLSRRITEGDRRLRAKIHDDWTPMGYLGSGLDGKTLGIIGMGRIGLAVAKLAQAFEMKVIYNKRTPYSPQEEEASNLSFRTIEEILEEADVVSVHCPLTPETRHLLGKEEFKRMKPSALVVNTARGPVINEQDLVDALKSGVIKGAALDVFEFEPQITEELLSLANVVLTPHIGSSTWEARVTMAQAAVQHIIDFFAGKRPTHIVNPEVLK